MVDFQLPRSPESRWNRMEHLMEMEYASIGLEYMGVGQNLLLSILMGWTSIYQLFWCSPGVQGFDTLPHYGNLDGFFFCFWCKLWRRWDVNQWDKTRMFQHLIISYPLFALNNDQWCFIVSKNQLYKLGRAITPAILAPSRPYPILLMFQRCTCLKIWISTAWYRYFVMICDDIPTQRIITIYIYT